jgi:hypothetical protein
MKPARLLLAVAAALLSVSAAAAQQPAPEGRNPSTEPPSFTNEDLPVTVPEPARDASAPAGARGDELTDEEMADAEREADTGGAPKAKGPSAAELDWRRRYAEAQRRSAAADKAAQEAEIRLTELRNQLGVGGARDRSAVLAQIEQQGQIISQTRDQAAAARAALESVRAEGARRSFSPDPGPPRRTKDGKPNREYYSARLTKAQAAVDDAERRITLYQNRIADLSTRLTINSGSGDQFTQLRIQGELREANEGLQKAQADRAQALQALDEARRSAEAAGFYVER